MSGQQTKRPDIIGIVTLGFFFLLVGTIFVVTPNLPDKISSFFLDFELREIAPNWMLPAPKSHHLVLYTAIFQFCLAFAIFQICILGARFILRDPIDKKAGTISSLVFCFGAAWVVSLLMVKTIGWFVFWGWLIALIGTSLVIKNAIVLMAQIFRQKK